MGGEERKKSRWRIDGWGHGVYLENAKANLFAAGKWIRFARRRNRKTNIRKLAWHKINARVSRKWKGYHTKHFERFKSGWKRIGYCINELNGWSPAWRICWILTVSITNVALLNDEIDAIKRATNCCLKR